MSKKSPLFDFHMRNGAAFVEWEDWLLPDHFGNSDEEYAALSSHAGVIDFCHRALLQFTGPDRLSFLQGMVSNDLRPLKMFEGLQAAILTQQGKIVADVRVLCAMNSFYLDFWDFLKDKVITHLNRYLVADEVEINDPNEQWKTLSIQGPAASNVLAEIFPAAEFPAVLNHHAMLQWSGAPVCIVNADHTGFAGYDLIVQTAQLEALAERLTASGLSWIGERAQNILRVEAGIPRYGIDMSEDNLLLEAALDEAVSFTKGCYLGQEVVERIRSRGHVNKKLMGLVLEGKTAPRTGTAIKSADKDIGTVTSSVVSPTLGHAIALGYVHRDFWKIGTPVSVLDNDSALPGVVAATPLVQRSSSP